MTVNPEAISNLDTHQSEHTDLGSWQTLITGLSVPDPRIAEYLATNSRLYDDLLLYCSGEHIDVDTLPDSQPARFGKLVCSFSHGTAEDAVGERSPLHELGLPVIPAKDLTAAIDVYTTLVGAESSQVRREALIAFQTDCPKVAYDKASKYIEISMALLFAGALEQEGCIEAAALIRADCMSIWGTALLRAGEFEDSDFSAA